MTATTGNALTDTANLRPPSPPSERRAGVRVRARAFFALLARDTYVDSRQLITFAAQVLLQPLFMLFIFGKVLGELGYTQPGYANLLMPGIVAMTAFLTALQSVAFPLVLDFSFLKEIEDRLLAPIGTGLVAVEKIVFASLRSLIAAAFMFPVSWLMLGFTPWTGTALYVVPLMLVLGALVGAAAGMTMGTAVSVEKINIVFGLILVPVMFTGSIQYPWVALANLKWFQIVSAINPLTYLSEGLRGALVPATPHIPIPVSFAVLVGFLILFTTLGMVFFRRRALD